MKWNKRKKDEFRKKKETMTDTQDTRIKTYYTHTLTHSLLSKWNENEKNVSEQLTD